MCRLLFNDRFIRIVNYKLIDYSLYFRERALRPRVHSRNSNYNQAMYSNEVHLHREICLSLHVT
jgi:hypothetical protein